MFWRRKCAAAKSQKDVIGGMGVAAREGSSVGRVAFSFYHIGVPLSFTAVPGEPGPQAENHEWERGRFFLNSVPLSAKKCHVKSGPPEYEGPTRT